MLCEDVLLFNIYMYLFKYYTCGSLVPTTTSCAGSSTAGVGSGSSVVGGVTSDGGVVGGVPEGISCTELSGGVSSSPPVEVSGGVAGCSVGVSVVSDGACPESACAGWVLEGGAASQRPVFCIISP